MSKSSLLASIEGDPSILDHWGVFLHQETPASELPASALAEWPGGRVVRDPFSKSFLGRVNVVLIDAFSVLFSPRHSYDFLFGSDEATIAGRRRPTEPLTPIDVAFGLVRVLKASFSSRLKASLVVLAFDKPDAVTIAKRWTQFRRGGSSFSHCHAPGSPIGATLEGPPKYFDALRDRSSRNDLVRAIVVHLLDILESGRTGFLRDWAPHGVIVDYPAPPGEDTVAWLSSPSPDDPRYARISLSDETRARSRALGEADDALAMYAFLLSSSTVESRSEMIMEVIANDSDYVSRILLSYFQGEATDTWQVYLRQYGGSARHRLWRLSGLPAAKSAASLTEWIVRTAAIRGDDYVDPTAGPALLSPDEPLFVIDYSRGLVVPRANALLSAVLSGWKGSAVRVRSREEARIVAKELGRKDLAKVAERTERLARELPLAWLDADLAAFEADDLEGEVLPIAWGSIPDQAAGRLVLYLGILRGEIGGKALATAFDSWDAFSRDLAKILETERLFEDVDREDFAADVALLRGMYEIDSEAGSLLAAWPRIARTAPIPAESILRAMLAPHVEGERGLSSKARDRFARLVDGLPPAVRATAFGIAKRRDAVLADRLVGVVRGLRALGDTPDEAAKMGETHAEGQALRLWWSVLREVKGREHAFSGLDMFLDSPEAWGFGPHGFRAGGAPSLAERERVYAELSIGVDAAGLLGEDDFDPSVLAGKDLTPSESQADVDAFSDRIARRQAAWLAVASYPRSNLSIRTSLDRRAYSGGAGEIGVLESASENNVVHFALERTPFGVSSRDELEGTADAGIYYSDPRDKLYSRGGIAFFSSEEFRAGVERSTIEAFGDTALWSRSCLGRLFGACARIRASYRDGKRGEKIALDALGAVGGRAGEGIEVEAEVEGWASISPFPVDEGLPKFLTAFESFAARACAKSPVDALSFAFDPISRRPRLVATFRIRAAREARSLFPWGPPSDPRVASEVFEFEEREPGGPVGTMISMDPVDGEMYQEFFWEPDASEVDAARWWYDSGSWTWGSVSEWSPERWRERFERLLAHRDPTPSPAEEIALYKQYVVSHFKVFVGLPADRRPRGDPLLAHVPVVGGNEGDAISLAREPSLWAWRRLFGWRLGAGVRPIPKLPFPRARARRGLTGTEWFLRWEFDPNTTFGEILEEGDDEGQDALYQWMTESGLDRGSYLRIEDPVHKTPELFVKGVMFVPAKFVTTSRGRDLLETSDLFVRSIVVDPDDFEGGPGDVEALIEFLEGHFDEVRLVPPLQDEAIATPETTARWFLRSAARRPDRFDADDRRGLFAAFENVRGLTADDVAALVGPEAMGTRRKISAAARTGTEFVARFFDLWKEASDAIVERGPNSLAAAVASRRAGAVPDVSRGGLMIFDPARIDEVLGAFFAPVPGVRRTEAPRRLLGIVGNLVQSLAFAATEDFLSPMLRLGDRADEAERKTIERFWTKTLEERKIARSPKIEAAMAAAPSRDGRLVLRRAVAFLVRGPKASRRESAGGARAPSAWSDRENPAATFPTRKRGEVIDELLAHPAGILGALPADAYDPETAAKLGAHLIMWDAAASVKDDTNAAEMTFAVADAFETWTRAPERKGLGWQERTVRWGFDAALFPIKRELYHAAFERRPDERAMTLFAPHRTSVWAPSLVEAVLLGYSLHQQVLGAVPADAPFPSRFSPMTTDADPRETYASFMRQVPDLKPAIDELMNMYYSETDERVMKMATVEEALARILKINLEVVSVAISADGAAAPYDVRTHRKSEEPEERVNASVAQILVRRSKGEITWHYETLVRAPSVSPRR
jgi:hypothetical protein